MIQVSISLHIDPPLAHTVNIEPLTATDWESKCCCCFVDLEMLTLNCGSH
jgi:hypothetical protein